MKGHLTITGTAEMVNAKRALSTVGIKIESCLPGNCPPAGQQWEVKFEYETSMELFWAGSIYQTLNDITT